jgi:chromosomal replication initiator protein
MITMTAEQTWKATLDQLRLQMTHATFNTWLKNARLVKCENNTYIIGVKNNYAKDWLENRLLSTIRRTLSNTAGGSVQVDFVVLPVQNQQEKGSRIMEEKNYGVDQSSNGDSTPPRASLPDPNGGPRLGSNLKLSPNYTFDRFVVGSSNRLGHAASLAVSERPGEAYNPLFLYGGVGLGKTHLLQAIAHRALGSDQRVIYVSSETFTNDFINSIRQQTTDTFREHYRNTDFLLIDDIQFIAGKESTQEEFFHTFNDVHSGGGQIVLTSDRLPRAIPTLEDRLSSRFEWGLLADIQPPDLETRLAILRFKADEIRAQVPSDVMDFIARRAQNNIRELEGALNKVVAHAALNREPISLEQAKVALQDLVNRRASLTVEMVIEAVSEYYNLTIEDIRGNSRSKRVSAPRHMAMYLAREETKASLPQIGESLGGRDHTTIMYGYDKVAKLIEHNERIRREAMQVREILYQNVA